MEVGENGLHGHHVSRTAVSTALEHASDHLLQMEAQIVLVTLIKNRNVQIGFVPSSSPDLRRLMSVIGILMSSKFWPLEVEEHG